MTLELDPQIAEALGPFVAGLADVAPPPVGDVDSRRVVMNAMLANVDRLQPLADDVRITDYELATADGARLLLRWYRISDSDSDSDTDTDTDYVTDYVTPGPAVLYLHGGGMILGSVSINDGAVSRLVSRSGVPFLAVDYRLAPEHPFPTPVEDAYAGLQWLHEHAAELDVDPARIAVMGDSAGGGLAAAVSILARDRGGPAIARQLLIFPMLDDRTTDPDAHIAPYAAWTYEDNITGWQAFLGARAGGADVPALAAPARLEDATGLPPAYLEVGQLDIFRDEDLTYALLLGRGGVPVELHLTPGAPHEYDAIAYQSDAAHRAIADRVRVIRSL
ncbi:alpha/beta hydrolase [Frankia sp. QA3]|uniref:alpha/beta hydrolase n=1 Tax=Frankia sp. QA3 TaxID=710111 RepID=UPI000269BFA7|nr:alpha/beta hydrolase [Frankia sp. QA3]EIV91528.1 esterase/lipase [Frankia sp. QA3]